MSRLELTCREAVALADLLRAGEVLLSAESGALLAHCGSQQEHEPDCPALDPPVELFSDADAAPDLKL